MNTIEERVLHYLDIAGAIRTNQHFVFTSGPNGLPSADGGGNHGTAYCNIRGIAHDPRMMDYFGRKLAQTLRKYNADVIIGPETLGRTLAAFTALHYDPSVYAIWCEMTSGSQKCAIFSEKLNFGRLVEGKRVAVVDDLLTSGGSIKLTAQLITEYGGHVVAGAAVVRRTPDVTADKCDVPALEVLADIKGFVVMSPDECSLQGPCSQRVPMVLRPGHGHEWIQRPENVSYPTA